MTEHKKRDFQIRGMDCAEEVAILKREVGPVVGGEQNLAFAILKGQMTVLAAAQLADTEGIIRVVQKTGMTASLVGADVATSETVQSNWWDKHGRIALTIASGLLTAVAFSLHFVLAGGLADVLGSEGLGKAHSVPLPVRAIYLLAVLAWALPCAP